MDISSDADAKLVKTSSPVAGKVDVHVMSMKNGIMEMRPITVLDIPAGKTVHLAPGKMHLMLMDVKKRLVPGEHVALKLTFMQGDRKTLLDVDAQVMSMAHHMDMMDMH